jgi:tight adherence protein B
MSSEMMIFAAMVGVAVFLLSQSVAVQAFGDNSKVRKRLRQRLDEIESAGDDDSYSSLLREKYLRRLSPFERRLESLPGMERLARLLEQAGYSTVAYRVVLLSFALGIALGAIGWSFTHSVIWAPASACLGLALPYFKITRHRKERMDKFEEQLPDAIDSMKRALKAGLPFAATLKSVAEDLDDPVAREFELTFADINYGNDTRRAMLGLLQRMPSVAVMAFVTAVLVQKETGGNLAEILEQISAVIRGRFKFFRKVRTLSAEGRMSAWILALVPFVLFLVITITTPEYLPVLLEDPAGVKLITAGAVMSVIGIFWIRKIIRIDM